MVLRSSSFEPSTYISITLSREYIYHFVGAVRATIFLRFENR